MYCILYVYVVCMRIGVPCKTPIHHYSIAATAPLLHFAADAADAFAPLLLVVVFYR